MIRLLLLPVLFVATAASADQRALSGEALDQKCTNSAKGLLQTVYRLTTSASMVVPAKDGKSRLIYLDADNGGKTEVHLYDCSPQSDGSVALAYQGVQEKQP
jgi:hypothetical protein